MGAKTCVLAYSDGPARDALARRGALDREAGERLVRGLFAGESLTPLDDATLAEGCYPPENEVSVAVFGGVAVLGAKEFGIDRPSELDPRFLAAARGRTVTVHAMHSVVDWTAFGLWEGGRLTRSLSVSGGSCSVLEDVGERRPFEGTFWAGERPAIDPASEEASDYPFPFHPLELGEAALAALLGFVLEGEGWSAAFDPWDVPVMRYARGAKRAWWRLGR